MSARPRGPQPSGPRAPGPREKTCCWSASSWLHLLRSWSLRSTRGGSTFPHRPSVKRLFVRQDRSRLARRYRQHREEDEFHQVLGFVDLKVEVRRVNKIGRS